MQNEISQLLTPQTHDFNGRTANGINGRALHQGLGVGRMYAHWIKARIQQGRFIENVDYLIVQNSIIDLPKLASSKGGNLRAVEYILSLDMAKHLCLMEKTEIAHEIRQHFIDCEKALAEIAPKVYRNSLAKTQARLDSIDYNHALNEAIEQWEIRNQKGKKPYHHSNEAEMLDSLVVGMNIRAWKQANDVTGNARKHFNVAQLALLKELLKADATLIDLDMPFQERKAQLTKLAQRYLSQRLKQGKE
ncbi:antA/AntB antirepressor family protein [Frederiksenia canicola]|uniref:Phage anti-repressor protein n=1 Tax=Frederiksenia canicola TaxID=123824 RepID=A0AAE6X697_9PAST|nr:antA/AntB antirepressor family protein [Frederiksenia canicola]QIM64219.1 hypothetical protein A4G17_01485 [Frederiksenia canicola]RPE93758.1 phage anti-repressor protein [Frederiksenia canicola]